MPEHEHADVWVKVELMELVKTATGGGGSKTRKIRGSQNEARLARIQKVNF